MRIIVHQPATAKLHEHLRKEVAVVHAKAVASYIQNLHCPKENKEALLKEISMTISQNNFKSVDDI